MWQIRVFAILCSMVCSFPQKPAEPQVINGSVIYPVVDFEFSSEGSSDTFLSDKLDLNENLEHDFYGHSATVTEKNMFSVVHSLMRKFDDFKSRTNKLLDSLQIDNEYLTERVGYLQAEFSELKVNASKIELLVDHVKPCDRGYIGHGEYCSDIDECDQDICDPLAICVNTLGSFICNCPAGYIGVNDSSAEPLSDRHRCKDVDECADGSHTCHHNANCKNEAPGFSCICGQGFFGDGFVCEDYDECETGDHDCGELGICTNTLGSYKCDCAPGYFGNGTNFSFVALSLQLIFGIFSLNESCHDIDECSEGNHDCDTNAFCINEPGNYTCECETGFYGDGRICSDINECKTSEYYCSPNTYCFNTVGSYACECVSNRRNGFVCLKANDISVKSPTPYSSNSKTKNEFSCLSSESVRYRFSHFETEKGYDFLHFEFTRCKDSQEADIEPQRFSKHFTGSAEELGIEMEWVDTKCSSLTTRFESDETINLAGYAVDFKCREDFPDCDPGWHPYRISTEYMCYKRMGLTYANETVSKCLGKNATVPLPANDAENKGLAELLFPKASRTAESKEISLEKTEADIAVCYWDYYAQNYDCEYQASTTEYDFDCLSGSIRYVFRSFVVGSCNDKIQFYDSDYIYNEHQLCDESQPELDVWYVMDANFIKVRIEFTGDGFTQDLDMSTRFYSGIHINLECHNDVWIGVNGSSGNLEYQAFDPSSHVDNGTYAVLGSDGVWYRETEDSFRMLVCEKPPNS